MKRLLLSAAATCLLLSPLACDLQKTGNQLVASRVMVGTLLSTPDVNVSAAALAGLDAGTLEDGGIPDSERITIPGQTAVGVFFGNRTSATGAPEPLADATVHVELQGGPSVALENKGVGTYSVTSGPEDDGGVPYQSGANYRFVAEEAGATYQGLVEKAPAVERIATLHPPAGYVHHTMNLNLTLQRPAVATGQTRTLGFVTVLPVSSTGDTQPPTYTNLPTDPLSIIELVAAPIDWTKDTVEIPGSAFPQANSNYLVIFQSAKSGGPETDNLFLGSALIVGSADVGVVHTQ